MKQKYEEKAKKIAEEQAAKQEAAEKAFNESLAMFPPSQSPANENRMSPAAAGRPNTPGGNQFPGKLVIGLSCGEARCDPSFYLL